MGNALGGLLQIAGSAGAGGFGAVRQNNADKIEALKSEALRKREVFLLGLKQGWENQAAETKYEREVALEGAKIKATSTEHAKDRASKEGINKSRIDADIANNQSNIDSRERISADTIGAAASREAMSRQTALEVAQIRASRSSGGGGGGKSDDLEKNQLKVLEITGKMLENGSPVEQVNEARKIGGLPPLEQVSTGTTESGGVLGFGTTKTENYELVPEGAGKKLSTVANEKGKVEAKNTKSLAELVSSVNEKKADQPQPEEAKKQPGLLNPAKVEESPEVISKTENGKEVYYKNTESGMVPMSTEETEVYVGAQGLLSPKVTRPETEKRLRPKTGMFAKKTKGDTPEYGKRADGTNKGSGFLGELKRPDGDISTEISIGVEMDGQEVEIPLLVPTLSKSQIDYLLKGGKATKEIVDVAVKHAQKRMQEGKSPFHEDN